MFYSHEMIVMLLPLILCLLQMQAKVRSEELHCRTGTAKTTSPMQLDEAISMSQCHIGCVRKVCIILQAHVYIETRRTV